VRGDQHIKLPNRCSSFGEYATDPSELRCGDFVEWHGFNGRRERVDEGVEFP
jgi:hypothetical protein